MLGQFGQGHREVRNDIFIKMLANRNQGSKKLVSLRTTFQINQVVYFPGNNGKSGQKKGLNQDKILNQDQMERVVVILGSPQLARTVPNRLAKRQSRWNQGDRGGGCI